MKIFFRSTAVGWPARLLAIGLLLGASPTLARQLPASVQPVQPDPAAYPVQAPVHGHLVDIFFTAGDRVKRGQLLAKLERPDGTPTYLLPWRAESVPPGRS